MTWSIGIDVGGTFTDFVLVGPGGDFRLLKVPTTLPDQSGGVMNGLARLADAEAVSRGRLLGHERIWSPTAPPPPTTR